MYRVEDVDKIKINMIDIQEKAMTKYREYNEPTLKEYKKVHSVILDFIKKKKRIIYGGFAINYLIKIKNPEEIFYRNTDKYDIEIYTYEPLADLIELCDTLKNENFKYVEGIEGMHNTTYKIFVNYENYCDIGYISKNIYDSCLKFEHNGFIFAHPYFLLIDIYRVFCDPLTSYWRLDKSFNRFLKLIKYYPLKCTNNPNEPIEIIKSDVNILKYIRKKIIHNSKYVVVGKYAYNYFVKKMELNLLNIDFYELISTNYIEDISKIYNILSKKYTVEFKEYTPFNEFFDRRIEYYINDVLVLIVYGNNNKCIVNFTSKKKKTRFGTFQLVFLYFISNYNYSHINKNKINAIKYMNIICNLIETRNEYLNKYNKTVLDKTPFEEFIFNCIGETLDPIRFERLKMADKKKKGLKLKFRYNPQENKNSKIPDYTFENRSGNEILNKKLLSLK